MRFPTVGFALAALSLLALPGCISPWAVMPAGRANFAPALYPPGTELVAVPVGDGELLQGVYVPGQPGAPVVLHLLEAMSSVTVGCLPEDSKLGACGFPVLWDLQDLGYGSLMLDYRGVGASTGTRHVDHLLEDTRAMWQEAVARAGGDPGMVVVRGTSLGTIGAADLMHAGERPAGWFLIAPVFGGTVASNVLYANLVAPVAWVADLIATAVADVDLLAGLRATSRPVLAFLPRGRGDAFLAADEHEAILATIAAIGGTVQELNRDHIGCAGGGHWLRPQERRWLRETFGTLAPVDARVAAALALGTAADAADPRLRARLMLLGCAANLPPALALAAARSDLPPQAMVGWPTWLARRAQAFGEHRDVAAWSRVLDLRDRSGRLSPELLTRLAPWVLARDLQQAPLDEPRLLLELGRRDFAAAVITWYGRERFVPEDWGLGFAVAMPLALCGYDLRDDPAANLRHIQATLHRARGEVLDEHAPSVLEAGQGLPNISLPLGAGSFDDSGSHALAPSSIGGLEPAVLRQACWAEQVAVGVPWPPPEDEAMLSEMPFFCDVPILARVWRQRFLLGGSLETQSWVDDAWLGRAAATFRGLPEDAQVALAESLLVAEAAVTPMQRWIRRGRERLAKRLIPVRVTDAERGRLEVFRGGRWQPAEADPFTCRIVIGRS